LKKLKSILKTDIGSDLKIKTIKKYVNFVKNYRMNTTKTTTVKAGKVPKERNWAIPDQVVSLEEIQTAIKSAEKGPFMKIQEAMNDFEQWLKSRQKRLS